MIQSRPATYFERLYRSSPDPWAFETSLYEQAKYDNTLHTLGNRHFTLALEVGCSIGVLTRMLAPRCTCLLGLDIVEAPLRAARTRCADYPHVCFERMQVPQEWPEGPFDLIVLSEVLYFLSCGDIDACAAHVAKTLQSKGIVLLVNWTGETDDPTSGDSASERFIAGMKSRLRIAHQERHADYRLDLLTPA